MTIDHVLAVVPVSDLERAQEWYAAFLGRPADNRPMDSLAEWRVTDSGWVQVFLDPERAGRGLLNFAVDDLDTQVADVAARGITPQSSLEASRGVALRTYTDPDGNTLSLIGNFRPEY